MNFTHAKYENVEDAYTTISLTVQQSETMCDDSFQREKCRNINPREVHMRAHPQDAITQSNPENSNFSINVPPAALIFVPRNGKHGRLKIIS